ncbi:MAG TPA: hypothetical protein VM204_00620, partial [Gaiellaceae bacterium]|nr:hypothetical protein [Gaiellaceae bacterium]
TSSPPRRALADVKRKRGILPIALGAALAAVLVAACSTGAEVEPPIRRGGDTSAPAPRPDASALADPECLAEAGTSCATATERVCERGEHAARDCNEVLRCVDSSWVATARTDCLASCPATADAPPAGACDVANAGTLLCSYAEVTCGCAPVLESEEDEGDDARDGGGGPDGEDAGATATDGGSRELDAGAPSRRYEWKCVTAEPGCPKTRPRLGERCVRPMSCDYGACLFEHGALMGCHGGRWDSEDGRDPCRR